MDDVSWQGRRPGLAIASLGLSGEIFSSQENVRGGPSGAGLGFPCWEEDEEMRGGGGGGEISWLRIE